MKSFKKNHLSQACFMRWKFCGNQWLGPGKGRFFTKSAQFKLEKVREQEQPRMTLTQGEFLFHYISSDGVVALAIAGVCSFLLALMAVPTPLGVLTHFYLIQTLVTTAARPSGSSPACWTSSSGSLGRGSTRQLHLPWTPSSVLSLQGNNSSTANVKFCFLPQWDQEIQQERLWFSHSGGPW